MYKEFHLLAQRKFLRGVVSGGGSRKFAVCLNLLQNILDISLRFFLAGRGGEEGEWSGVELRVLIYYDISKRLYEK